MSKLKFLTLLSITLAIINIVLVGFFLLGPRHGKKQHEPKKHIIKQLNLDEEQVGQYDLLIEEHQKKRKVLNKKNMELRNELYIVTLKEVNLSKKNEILAQLTLVRQDLELVHLGHFEQLKKICREDQQEQFEALVDELTHLFDAKHKKKKH
jgi:hypothetical protein